MSESSPPAVDSPESFEQGAKTIGPVEYYEKSDVATGSILILFVGVALIVAVVQVGLWLMVGLFESQARTTDAQVSPLAGTRPAITQPELQVAAFRDYQEFERAQEERLNEYAIEDPKNDRVRIPISRAMELIIQRGLLDRDRTSSEK